MRRFDAASAECLVFTEKDGLLSAVAHDLKIHVTQFAIEVDEEARRVRAELDAGSLRVVCALRDGEDAPELLSNDNRSEIERNIVEYVLDAARYPRIELESDSVDDEGDGYVVHARLRLHGVEQPIAIGVRRAAGKWTAEATVHQPDFGIRPYTALLGALKVKPDVRIRLVVPE